MPVSKRLLPGENPGSLDLSDAEHWTAVFQELVEEHRVLLAQVEARPGAPIQDELDLLQANLAWLRRRLTFWRRRRQELSGRQ
jgi:hypothetical protein